MRKTYSISAPKKKTRRGTVNPGRNQGNKKARGLPGLSSLYDRIHDCTICPGMYRKKKKARRREDAVSKDMDVFIISQALARETMFESGVNYFKVDGTPGSTGKNLEKLLNSFGRTIYPKKRIRLERGTIEPSPGKLLPAYNSEMAQCFPGKAKKNNRDRKPSADELKKCLEQGFLRREIEIIKPRLIILMGRLSRDVFYKYYLNGNSHPNSLSDHIKKIITKKSIPAYRILGKGMPIHVLPIQHASGGNYRFGKMMKDRSFKALVELIKGVLDEKSQQ